MLILLFSSRVRKKRWLQQTTIMANTRGQQHHPHHPHHVVVQQRALFTRDWVHREQFVHDRGGGGQEVGAVHGGPTRKTTMDRWVPGTDLTMAMVLLAEYRKKHSLQMQKRTKRQIHQVKILK